MCNKKSRNAAFSCVNPPTKPTIVRNPYAVRKFKVNRPKLYEVFYGPENPNISRIWNVSPGVTFLGTRFEFEDFKRL